LSNKNIAKQALEEGKKKKKKKRNENEVKVPFLVTSLGVYMTVFSAQISHEAMD